MRSTPPILLSVTLALSGCADLPDVSSTVSPAAQASGYPQLIPLAPLLATLPPAETPSDMPQAALPAPSAPVDLDTRRQALQSRADALREAAL